MGFYSRLYRRETRMDTRAIYHNGSENRSPIGASFQANKKQKKHFIIESLSTHLTSALDLAATKYREDYALRTITYCTENEETRTKATLIYRRTKNLRAVQLLLGHTKLESTAHYLGIEVDDALEISEQTEV
jgi:hypothetical protein